jgi:hypothetical protein
MDDFKGFIEEYRKNVEEVSAKAMLKCIKEIDSDLLDAGICWMVTDNMVCLLAVEEHDQPSSVSDPETWQQLEGQLENELGKNRLVILGQDIEKDDHWFALIPDGEKVHLVEHSPRGKNFSETFIREELIQLLLAIKKGEIPERFYGLKGDHTFRLLSFERKPMQKERIAEFLA